MDKSLDIVVPTEEEIKSLFFRLRAVDAREMKRAVGNLTVKDYLYMCSKSHCCICKKNGVPEAIFWLHWC